MTVGSNARAIASHLVFIQVLWLLSRSNVLYLCLIMPIIGLSFIMCFMSVVYHDSTIPWGIKKSGPSTVHACQPPFSDRSSCGELNVRSKKQRTTSRGNTEVCLYFQWGRRPYSSISTKHVRLTTVHKPPRGLKISHLCRGPIPFVYSSLFETLLKN